jgi:hypothetical protein
VEREGIGSDAREEESPARIIEDDWFDPDRLSRLAAA